VLTHERGRATLQEIETYWSLDDLISAHLALDVVDALEEAVARKQKEQAEAAQP